MYKRLIILSLIMGIAVLTLAAIGYLSLEKWQQGLKGQRLGEFARVALQVQADVKQKLDRFIMVEQSRPYTDYYPYYLADPNSSQMAQIRALVRSPLWGRLDHGLAFGHFQVQPDGNVVTPNDDLLEHHDPNTSIATQIQQIKSIISTQLLPLLRPAVLGAGDAAQGLRALGGPPIQSKAVTKAKFLPIDSLNTAVQPQQIVVQDRQLALTNIGLGPSQAQHPAGPNMEPEKLVLYRARQASPPDKSRAEAEAQDRVVLSEVAAEMPQPAQQAQAVVTVRIDPLVPVVIRSDTGTGPILKGSVYMVRHVQVEDQHLLQGFRLDGLRLLAEVEESARRFVRQDMGFELSSIESQHAAYAALLDFGFGSIVLNLTELDPGQITRKVQWLHRWYLLSVSLVLVAVGLGLAALWHGTWQQMQLSRQKDNFISAVSHELRTPLAGIRMCAEMLEKGWVCTDAQRARYYQNIRQEGERLSRLIENVLGFSRLQQGRQRYNFVKADLNELVRHVVETARHLAECQGLTIQTDLAPMEPLTFDKDAVTQILLNLLDNAVKFAHPSTDNTIIVRTRSDSDYALIQIEDHGPGIPPSERSLIFKEFYRIESEATRSTTGVGLGLALARRFAVAHNGFISVSDAQPQGAIFTVGLHR